MPRLLSNDLFVIAGVGLWLLAVYVRNARRRHSGLSHPPGPRGLPLVGNYFDMPKGPLYFGLVEWRKIYGDLIFVKILNRNFLFIYSYDVAVDLMEKRSAVYSSRGTSFIVNELEDWGWVLANMPYGERFRKHRTAIQRFLMPELVDTFQDMQLRETHKMLDRLLHDPSGFFKHVRELAASVLLQMTYGYEVAAKDDHYISVSQKGIRALAVASTPGNFLVVNAIPILRYLPEWLPGVGFKRVANAAAKLSRSIRYELYHNTKAKVLNGTAPASITRQMLEEVMNESTEVAPDEEDVISASTGMLYLAGIDTTVSVMLSFILAMLLNPDVQRRGQEELDRVVGRDALPTFADRKNLPYVEAIYKECLRWQSSSPIGVPHATSDDDMYNGYFIPCGTIIVPCQWMMLRDPDVYKDPESFVPERWLSGDASLIPPDKIAFGFGRRICPGRFMVENGVLIMIASMLATINIEKARGADGRPIEPSLTYIETNLRTPLPFECNFTPRSKQSEPLIRQAVESAP